MPAESISIRGLKGIPEILPGMNLTEKLLSALELAGISREDDSATENRHDGIVIVVAQKVVSKSEGCLVRLEDVIPSAKAQAWARTYHKDARVVEVVLQQARRVVRMDRGILIAETRHGFVCANAGVDTSNAPSGAVVLLPPDPDQSAAKLRRTLESALHRHVGVIISDTFGRPWRMGLTNVAIGVSGLSPFIDYRGQVDSYGRPLQATILAAADELAGAAELVMGKTAGIPAAIIAGFQTNPAEGSGTELIRPAEEDLFR
jgi:coenzyme F420-0:L-glutamate ligase / coenzyme F420-1:gamma-L-glutamate ligase